MTAPPLAAATVPSVRWRWHARMVWVLAKTQFKLRYTDSALGYFWSLARPLALFAILYVIFGRALRIGAVEHYAVFLLIGVVLFTFFQEATSRTMSSIVDQNQLLRRLAFPRVIVPLSVSVTSLINLALNLAAVVAFVAWERIVPRLEWLFLVPLFLELYVFVLAVSLILATLFARLQDIGAIWEVLLRIFFYASGVIFPLQALPEWARQVVLVNPFTQVMQDVRAVVLHDVDVVTASDAFGAAGGRLVPVAATLVLAVSGYAFFRRNESWFAEQV